MRLCGLPPLPCERTSNSPISGFCDGRPSWSQFFSGQPWDRADNGHRKIRRLFAHHHGLINHRQTKARSAQYLPLCATAGHSHRIPPRDCSCELCDREVFCGQLPRKRVCGDSNPKKRASISLHCVTWCFCYRGAEASQPHRSPIFLLSLPTTSPIFNLALDVGAPGAVASTMAQPNAEPVEDYEYVVAVPNRTARSKGTSEKRHRTADSVTQL